MVTKFYKASHRRRNSLINRLVSSTSELLRATPKTHGADPDNVAWSATGLHAEKSRFWGFVSAAIINRPGSEAR